MSDTFKSSTLPIATNRSTPQDGGFPGRTPTDLISSRAKVAKLDQTGNSNSTGNNSRDYGYITDQEQLKKLVLYRFFHKI